MKTPPRFYAQGDKSSWATEFQSGKLSLLPNVISLRLHDILRAYYTVWSRYASDPKLEPPELTGLFTAAGIKETFDNAAPTNQVLTQRLARVQTDFVLRDKDRQILDLSAYLLVHGSLEPAISEWIRVANERINEQRR